MLFFSTTRRHCTYPSCKPTCVPMSLVARSFGGSRHFGRFEKDSRKSRTTEYAPFQSAISTMPEFSKSHVMRCTFHGIWQSFNEDLYPLLNQNPQDNWEVSTSSHLSSSSWIYSFLIFMRLNIIPIKYIQFKWFWSAESCHKTKHFDIKLLNVDETENDLLFYEWETKRSIWIYWNSMFRLIVRVWRTHFKWWKHYFWFCP